MKYETPELTVLSPAISAIQGHSVKKVAFPFHDALSMNEGQIGYADWE
jgi:hypothetical protein